MNNKIEIEHLLDLKMHDAVVIRDDCQCVRVPGGWIYYVQTDISSPLAETFVPEPLQIDYDQKYLDGMKDVEKMLIFIIAVQISFVIVGFLLFLIIR